MASIESVGIGSSNGGQPESFMEVITTLQTVTATDPRSNKSYLVELLLTGGGSSKTLGGGNGTAGGTFSPVFTFGEADLIAAIYVRTVQDPTLFTGTNGLGCAALYFQTLKGETFSSDGTTPSTDPSWQQVMRMDSGEPFANLQLAGIGGQFGWACDQLQFYGIQPSLTKR